MEADLDNGAVVQRCSELVASPATGGASVTDCLPARPSQAPLADAGGPSGLGIQLLHLRLAISTAPYRTLHVAFPSLFDCTLELHHLVFHLLILPSVSPLRPCHEEGLLGKGGEGHVQVNIPTSAWLQAVPALHRSLCGQSTSNSPGHHQARH